MTLVENYDGVVQVNPHSISNVAAENGCIGHAQDISVVHEISYTEIGTYTMLFS